MPALAARLVAAGLAALRWPARAYANRRLQEQLAAMSDLHLRDIGLTRQDVVDTGILPLGSEVGCFLASRAREGRWRGR